jgi:hypothetical protein
MSPRILLALALAAPLPAAAAPTRSVTAFCRAHPALDHPAKVFWGADAKPGRLPKAVAAAEATDWRCMDGKVMICNASPAGNACWKMDNSGKPSPGIREFCQDNPDADFVPMVALADSAATYRCAGTAPKTLETVPLDQRGFMRGTWAVLGSGQELGADPR